MTQLQIGPVASIRRIASTAPTVGDNQAAATASATDEAGQQRSPAPPRLCVAGPAVRIAGQHCLIALVLGPADVAFVMILDEHLPGVHRLSVAVALARAAIDDLSALLALPVSVDTSIKGVL